MSEKFPNVDGFCAAAIGIAFTDDGGGKMHAACIDPREGIVNAAALIAAVASLEHPEPLPEHDATSTAGSSQLTNR